MSLFNLKNKSILITGSSRGIGKAIAKHCALHGANVIISSRKADVCQATTDEINELVGEELAHSIPASISEPEQLEQLVLKTREKLAEHPVEKVGAELRALMPWIAKKKLIDSDKK